MQTIERISKLFTGLTTAHGIFIPEDSNGKKQQGKCNTIKETVTQEIWNRHLNGTIGLGIIPIDETNQVHWAVVDVDIYDLDITEMMKRVENYPFIVCQSKSGGFHLFLFFKHPAMAKDVREYLRSQVAALGLGSSEIFPKQDTVIAKRGDIGNWLNMPYFGDTRKCIVQDQELGIIELDLEDFCTYAENNKVDIITLQQTGVKLDYNISPLVEGPPCLQTLSLQSFPSGTRNISLFNIGVYCKKAFPNEWQKKVEQFNRTLFKDPLMAREVEVIKKSLEKKDYFYQCYEEPLCSFCNAKLCRTRKFGISGVTSMPIINSVTKVTGDFSMWFIDVEGGRLELTTEELFDHRKFLMKCVNSLNMLPNKMTAVQWTSFIQGILDKAIMITDENMFKRHEIPELFYMFLMNRVSEVEGELSAGRVFYDKDKKEIMFKMEAFMNFLKHKRAQIDKGWIIMYFKNRGLRSSVGKDKERKSFRYSAIPVSDEEVKEIEIKLRLGTVV